MVGLRLSFRVVELKDRGDAVLSRRVLLEEERASAAEVTREKLEVGARFRAARLPPSSCISWTGVSPSPASSAPSSHVVACPACW